MRSTLVAIKGHPKLRLQLIVTGMHLDRSRGRSLDAIRAEGWTVDAVIPWAKGDGSPTAAAGAMGKATASLAKTFAALNSEIVLVVGDRVEAFAAASAAHVSNRLVAHVHGGDRALGLVDDSLRHAITKLAHIHFPATQLSAQRIKKMGEDSWRIVRAGSPGLDAIRTDAAPRTTLAREFPGLGPRTYALLLLHPQSPDPSREGQSAKLLLKCVEAIGFQHVLIVYPNNDPGAQGIASYWDELAPSNRRIIRRDLPRELFLGLMRDAAILVGNSSSGIIEAASFGAPVLDIGDRQAGRERGTNVAHAQFNESSIQNALKRIWRSGNPIRFPAKNGYGSGGAGQKIASTLAEIKTPRFLRKLIAY